MFSLFLKFVVFLFINTLPFQLLGQTNFDGKSDFKKELNLRIHQTKTSDDFSVDQFSLDIFKPQHDLYWPYENEPNSGTSFSGSLQGGKIQGKTGISSDSPSGEILHQELLFNILRKSDSEWSQKFSLGAGQLQFAGEKNRQVLLFEGKVQWAKKEFSSELLLRQQPEVIDSASVLAPLFGRDSTLVSPFFRWKWNDRWKVDFRSKHQWINDGNLKNHGEVSVMNGLLMDPWLWVGFGSEYFGYRLRSSDYWSPEGVAVNGLRLDSAFPIAATNWSFLMAGSLNHIKEIGVGEGQGFYVNTSAQYGRRGERQIRLGFEAIQSRQKDSTWRYQQVFVQINGF